MLVWLFSYTTISTVASKAAHSILPMWSLLRKAWSRPQACALQLTPWIRSQNLQVLFFMETRTFLRHVSLTKNPLVSEPVRCNGKEDKQDSLLREHLAVDSHPDAPHSQALRCGAIVPGPVPWGRPAVKLTDSYHFPRWFWLACMVVYSCLKNPNISWESSSIMCCVLMSYHKKNMKEYWKSETMWKPWTNTSWWPMIPKILQDLAVQEMKSKNGKNDWWWSFIVSICDCKLAWTSCTDASRHHKSKVRSADSVLIGKWRRQSTCW